jgi:hypothetical protein
MFAELILRKRIAWSQILTIMEIRIIWLLDMTRALCFPNQARTADGDITYILLSVTWEKDVEVEPVPLSPMIVQISCASYSERLWFPVVKANL